VGAEAQLSAQPPVPPWELIDVIGTVIMVTGTGVIFIIGTVVIAGFAHRVEDRTWCRLGTAVDAMTAIPGVTSPPGMACCRNSTQTAI